MPWSPARPRGTAGAPRAVARALARAVPAIALAAGAASAQPVTLNFNSLTAVDASGVRYVDNCYAESGVQVRVSGLACGTAAALATWTPDNPLFYTGSPALYANLGASVDFTALNGGALSVSSIGLAPLLGTFGVPTTVSFMGMQVGGGSVMQTVQVPGGTTMMSMYSLANFTNLTTFRLTVTSPGAEPYVQFDNVMLTVGPTQVIPEPATVVLLASGLLGVGAASVARRRRRAA